ncbi:hypothetical protein OO184_16875 [Photorhabdus sp. APURE]|uniref:hypothetical protein n=1 Tax=Photorhabdus aballayi TaxID=2991723 RepID=UPI00223D1700|nr:hypothetical protein [Photorhabdus aballayi]MCW7549564.1 hypothetical protein [Photorhabdus aballayi]
MQSTAAIDQAAIPVGQTLAGMQVQTLRSGDYRISPIVVDDPATHRDLITHDGRRIVQGVAGEHDAVSFQAPQIAQCPSGQLQRFPDQGTQVGEMGTVDS